MLDSAIVTETSGLFTLINFTVVNSDKLNSGRYQLFIVLHLEHVSSILSVSAIVDVLPRSECVM